MTSGYVPDPLLEDPLSTTSANYGAEVQPAENVEVQPAENDYDPNYRRERLGNNRYHQPKVLAKARRKIAKKSKQRNRRKP